MSTLRISNIEAKSVPASATIDEKVKITNSSGDPLVFIDGKTSGITTVGINTTDGNITFDANSNIVVTGIITATRFSGEITPTSLEIGSNIKLGNAGVITATSFVGSGANLTNLPAPTTITVADESTDTTCFPLYATAASGNLAPKTGSNLTFNSSSGNLRTGSLFLGQGSNESKTQDGLIMERSTTDGEVHISAGRSGGNNSGLQFYVAGASGVTKRHQIDYQSNFRWYGADGTTERVRITNTGNLEKRGGGSYFAYNSSGYYAKQDNYDSTGGKSYWYDGGSGNNNIVASVDGQTGNLMSKGNLRILTTGKGIDFSTTSDAGGMSSEILDDYEEGTFSPGWFDDGGVFVSSYTVQYGQYTKIGNVVYFCFGLRIGTFSRTPNSGQACRVGNLPFVSREVGDDQEPVFNLYARLWGSGTPPETAWIRQSSGSGSNHVEFYMDESQTGNDHRLVGADFDTSSTCRVVVTGFYFTS